MWISFETILTIGVSNLFKRPSQVSGHGLRPRSEERAEPACRQAGGRQAAGRVFGFAAAFAFVYSHVILNKNDHHYYS